MISNETVSALAFFLGVVFQGVRALYAAALDHRAGWGWVWRRLNSDGFLLSYGIMVVYSGFNSKIPEIPEKIYVLAGLFIFTLTLTLHRYLVPVIHEGTLFVYTAIVCFLALGAYGEIFGWPLYLFLAIPTIAIGASIVSLKKPPFVFQVLMYAWFLVCSLFLLVITWFSFAEAKNVFQLFMLGVVAFPLGVCVLSLWEFVPLPGKRQSFASRMRQWRE